MLTILLHSSKTTRHPTAHVGTLAPRRLPALINDAVTLADYLKSLSPTHIQQSMKFSKAMADKTYQLLQRWDSASPTLPAVDLFLGDIYSGLQVQTFTDSDRAYAHRHLFILSGLYGVLRALDEIQPYRLEMGYKLPGNAHDTSQPNIVSLYTFWGDKITQQLPKNQDIINLSAVEYTKAVFSYLKDIDGLQDVKVISPKFLTISPKTNEPIFVTVHAKIARGAFARWLIQNRINTTEAIKNFAELGYRYDTNRSTPDEPVFVAKKFQGIGLSIRLT